MHFFPGGFKVLFYLANSVSLCSGSVFLSGMCSMLAVDHGNVLAARPVPARDEENDNVLSQKRLSRVSDALEMPWST